MRRTVLLALAVSPMAVLVACSASAADYSSEAESFIEESDGAMARQQGQTFQDARCAEPASTDVGTTFECTATASDGSAWSFSAVIVEDREIEVTSLGADAARIPTATTAPPATTG